MPLPDPPDKPTRTGAEAQEPTGFHGPPLSRRRFIGRSAVGIAGASLAGPARAATLPFPAGAPDGGSSTSSRIKGSAPRNRHYPSGREPLAPAAYVPLPLGSIAPRGWLRAQLERAAEGLTGRLDDVWPDVGPENGWLGGGGDLWERGPYWLDGLVPLAHALGDERLIRKARRWIDWALASQRPSGDFGPAPADRRQRQGSVQNGADWWPKMIMLKVLQQHHEATGDERVPPFMSGYFRYQLSELPRTPLDHWSHWARARGGENLASIHWLYDRTGESDLLDLGRLVTEQTQPWGRLFHEEHAIWHVVNTAMAIKQPAVWWRQSRDARDREAVEAGLAYLMERHGHPEGIWSGDELLHGTDPAHGTETCAVVEYMFSLETVLSITGHLRHADRLERVAYNALPAAIKDDYTARHYYQTPNQVACTTEYHNFSTRHGDDNLMGLETGYGCCTANLHQGWPKLTAHLWMATPDDGLAALVYAPSEVRARVGEGTEVRLVEETDYPFGETVRITYHGAAGVRFPLHLRIPGWAEGASAAVNGGEPRPGAPGTILRVERRWSEGDVVELTLPMRVRLSRWHERSAAVEHGPLLYALRLREDWLQVGGALPFADWEVRTPDAWNYGLLREAVREPEGAFAVRRLPVPENPWTPTGAPVEIRARAKRIPEWRAHLGSTGPLPWSPIRSEAPEEEVVLVPYGATTLRIAAFPVAR